MFTVIKFYHPSPGYDCESAKTIIQVIVQERLETGGSFGRIPAESVKLLDGVKEGLEKETGKKVFWVWLV